METSSKTKLLGIFGKPIEHTLSPKMHSYFAQKTGLDTAYLAFHVEGEDFREIVAAAKKMGACGFNITSPYKIDVMDCVDVLDSEAELMGSVNTIVNRNGKWYGYNTDGDGFVNSLRGALGELKNRNVLLLGAGGSARSISYKLAKNGVSSITISARNKEKINKIAEVIKKNTDCIFYDEMDASKHYDIIVNMTPLGMHPHENVNPFAEHMEIVDENTICCDLIYNPNKTLFLKEAEARGAKIMNGLPMLILQGMYAYELFCDVKLGKECFDELLEMFSQYRI